jgi:hypothetical protein
MVDRDRGSAILVERLGGDQENPRHGSVVAKPGGRPSIVIVGQRMEYTGSLSPNLTGFRSRFTGDIPVWFDGRSSGHGVDPPPVRRSVPSQFHHRTGPGGLDPARTYTGDGRQRYAQCTGASGVFSKSAWIRLRVLVTPEKLQIEVAGVPRESRRLPAQPLEGWDPSYRLALGNELTGDRSWVGEIRRTVVQTESARLDNAQPGCRRSRSSSGTGRTSISSRFWDWA